MSQTFRQMYSGTGKHTGTKYTLPRFLPQGHLIQQGALQTCNKACFEMNTAL